MKNADNLFFIIFFLISNFIFSQKIIVNASSFGLSEDADATFAIQKALVKCKELGAKKLIIPKGIYHFYPNLAYEQYDAISNHDNGLKRIGFPIIGMTDFEIDASGSSFIFHGYMVPFLLENSKNIQLKNFSIDWDKPFHLQGKVVHVDTIKKSFQLKISDENEYEVIGTELNFHVFGKKYTIQNNIWFDPVTKATVYDVPSYKIDTWNPNIHLSYKAKDVGNRVVEIQHQVAKLPELGWIFVAKGRTDGNRARYSPAIHINKSTDVSLSDINIYHAGGMGLIAEKSTTISLQNFNVLLPPDKDRLVSTTADATHFMNCKGKITIINCTFENMLDDATNIHGAYLNITKQIDKNTIEAKTKHYQQFGFEFATKGDTVRIIDGETFKTIQTLVVKEIKIFNEQNQHIMFDEEVSTEINQFSTIENVTWNPSVVIKNCKVWRNRARSLLIKVEKPILIEDSYFSSMMNALLIGSGGNGMWGESGAVNEILIRNNHFVDNCTGIKNKAVILIKPSMSKFEDDFYFNKNVIIENNTFEAFNRDILSVISTENLIFRNNTIIETTTFTPWSLTIPTLALKHCKNAIIENNTYKGKIKATIDIDKNTRKSTVLNQNRGFEKF